MKTFLLALVMCLAVHGIAAAAVNINTATKEELTSLKGIGEKRARDIVDYRTKNGPFKTGGRCESKSWRFHENQISD